MPPGAGKPAGSSAPDGGRRVARGWIAIGDDARGILLAIGSTARGLVALGGRAFGVVSFGGLALGLVAFGGLGLGVLGIGGLGAGVYAFGGGAVGWRAAGGLAIGWDIACGGGAIRRARGHRRGRDRPRLCRRRRGPRPPRQRRGGPARPSRSPVHAIRVHRDGSAAGPRATRRRRRDGPSDPPPAPRGQFLLDNGLTVRIRPIQGASDVALLVLYKIGGDHDPQGRSGLAHLVEHLYVTAAAGAVPARTAEAFFQRYRAGCNAQTGDRYTVVATVFPKGDLEKELTEAAARMGDLRITAADLDREKPRLLDEVANNWESIHASSTARSTPSPNRTSAWRSPKSSTRPGTPVLSFRWASNRTKCITLRPGTRTVGLGG